MAVNQTGVQFAYGMGDNLIPLAPFPIIARRDPTSSDLAQIGTLWVNNPADTAWILTSVIAGQANWTTSPVAGATVVASLQVTGAGGIVVDTGDVDITLGDLNVTAGSATIGNDLSVGDDAIITGDLTVNGATIINGDFDLTSATLIDLTSTLDAAPSIYLHADGGTSEQILIHSDQGTAVNSIELDSDVGGITVVSGLASADAINLSATAGGVDIDGALQVNIASSQNAANAIVLSASAGGIDILASGAATEDIDIINTGGSVNITATEDVAQAVYIRANGGTSETIQLHSDQGTAANSINILSDAGGVTISGGLATADAINILSAAAAGGIDIDSGTGGIAIDSTGAFSIDGAATSNVSVSGAGIDLSLVSAGGRVIVNGEEAAADAITVLSAAGGLDANVALQMNLDSAQAAADAVRIIASNAAGGLDIDSGTGGITIDSTGAYSIDGAAASNVSVSGAGIDLSIASAAGRVVVDGGEAAADAIRIVASNAAGGIDIDSGTGGIALDSTAGFSIDSATASNITVTGAAQDLTLSAAGGSVNVLATEASADAIVLNASNAAGGIDLLTGGGEISISSAGNVTMVAATDTQASPTATATINARVGVATFTGFTTAAGANEDFTITNSTLTAGAGVFVTVSNTGSNDADMTLEGVITETAGSLVIHTQNNGAAALNGDVVISFWVIN